MSRSTPATPTCAALPLPQTRVRSRACTTAEVVVAAAGESSEGAGGANAGIAFIPTIVRDLRRRRHGARWRILGGVIPRYPARSRRYLVLEARPEEHETRRENRHAEQHGDHDG